MTSSSRRVLARQRDQALLEALVSFTAPLDSFEHQQPIPDVPGLEPLPSVQEQLSPYPDEHGGHWVRPQPLIICDTSTRRRAWRSTGPSHRRASGCGGVPPNRCPTTPSSTGLLTYVSGTALLETAMVVRRTTPLTSLFGTDRPRGVVSSTGRLLGLGALGCCRSQRCPRSRPGHRDDVQPPRSGRRHRHPGDLLRPRPPLTLVAAHQEGDDRDRLSRGRR